MSLSALGGAVYFVILRILGILVSSSVDIVCWRRLNASYLRLDHYLEGWRRRKTIKSHYQVCPGRDLNPGQRLERPLYLTWLYYRGILNGFEFKN